MGNQGTKPATEFSAHQSSFLMMVYQGLIMQSTDGKHIDKKTFLSFFKYPGMFGERIFRLFDVSERGYLNCDEFTGGLARFLNGSTDQKIEILFKLYDLSGTNSVSYEDLTTILYSLISMPYIVPGGKALISRCRAKMKENDSSEAERRLKSQEPRSQLLGKLQCQHELVGDLASAAFRQVSRDPQAGKLTFAEFHQWIKGSPDTLRTLEVSFAQHLWAQPSLDVDEKAVHWASQTEGCGSVQTPMSEPSPPVSMNTTLFLDPQHVPHGVNIKAGEVKGVELVGRMAKLKDNILYLYDSTEQPESIFFMEGLYVTTFQDQWSALGYGGLSLASGSRSVVFYLKESLNEWLVALRTAAKNHPIHETYTLGRQLGQGRNAVFLATHKKTGKEYAAKVIHKGEITAAETEALRAEVAILKLVCHPNIIYLQEVFEDPTTLYLIMPLMAGGDLFDALLQVRCFSEDTTRQMTQNLLSALSYLHGLGIVHRDIKPENILLVSKDQVSDIILSDFGLSLFASADQVMKIACGTLSYVAPEVLQAQGYTRATDIWGVGILCYLLLSGTLPFKGPAKTDVIRAIIEQPVSFDEPVWRSISAEAKDFIKLLLERNPLKRAKVDEAIAHSWFRAKLSEPVTLSTAVTVHTSPQSSSVQTSLSSSSSSLSSKWKEPSSLPSSFSFFTRKQGDSLQSLGLRSSDSMASASSNWREPSRLPSTFSVHRVDPQISDSPPRKFNQFDIAKQESAANWSSIWREPSKVDFSQLLTTKSG